MRTMPNHAFGTYKGGTVSYTSMVFEIGFWVSGWVTLSDGSDFGKRIEEVRRVARIPGPTGRRLSNHRLQDSGAPEEPKKKQKKEQTKKRETTTTETKDTRGETLDREVQ